MSIIIKGFNMPKKHESLKIEILSDGDIWIDEGRRYSRKENAVVEIPKEHGRLIDADELQELYADTDGLDLSNYDVKVAVIRQNIKDMPTILEEEK